MEALSDAFDEALHKKAQRIIDRAIALAEAGEEEIEEGVKGLLVEEAPEGMPLGWVMYIKEMALSLGVQESGPGARLLERVGKALAEAIDEGEVQEL